MFNWRSVILKPDDTLKQAIQVLDQESLKIVLVADDEGRLLGTLTDGDVRRALIQQRGMESELTDCMSKQPTVAAVGDDQESIFALMKSRDVLQVPILDSGGRIVGLETIRSFLVKDRVDNPVFLMAGGFGKRLHPMTHDTPKPLLKIGDKPILEMILKQFIDAGFHNFYISTHYKAEMIRDYFGNGDNWNVSIQYIHEESPLGTAGSLGLLPKTLPDLPILVMNGDLLTKVNYKHLLDFHIEQGGEATMCAREYDIQVPYGVVEVEGQQVKSIIEKPVHKFYINAGIYVLNSSKVKSVMGDSFLDMPNFLEGMVKYGEKVNMFPIHEYWLDIGRIEEFEKAQIDVIGMF